MPDGLVATAQPGAHPRVLLQLTWAGARTATITRTNPDGQLVPVRNAEAALVAGMLVVHDNELPLDQAVTYRATSPAVTVASDTFTRSVADSWGTASPTGGTYLLQSAAADHDVNGTAGTIQPAAVGSRRSARLDLGLVDLDARIDIAMNATPATGSNSGGIIARYTDSDNYYLARMQVSTTSTVTLLIEKRVAAVTTTIVSVLTSLTHTNDVYKTIRFRVVGSSLSAKIWDTASPEPAAWTLSTLDTSIVSGPGVGAYGINNTAVTTHIFSYDNFLVDDLAHAGLTSSAVTVASGGHTYLRHVAVPTLGRRVTIREPGPRSLPARRGVARPIDRADPIVVHQIRSTDSGVLQLITDGSLAELTALRAMLADGSPLLLQTPLTWGGEALYISVDTVAFDTLVRFGPQLRRYITLPFDVIGRPSGPSGGSVGSTYADLDAAYGTYANQTASGRTYASLTAAP